MRILELFSGTYSFGKVALEMGYDITGVDILPCPADLKGKVTHHQVSILDFDYKQYPKGYFTFIWSSPPCETYSMAGIRHGLRKNCIAVTDKARLHDSFVKRSNEIIYYLDPEYDATENPRACLKKQPFMQDRPVIEVSYCKYGGDRMKPTNLFGNLPEAFDVRMCHNGNPDHIPSPRGSKHNSDATIPPQLCREILEAIEVS